MVIKEIQYLSDGDGHKTAVLLPIDVYEELMEDLGMAQAYLERKDEERIPWATVRAELVTEGKLDA